MGMKPAKAVSLIFLSIVIGISWYVLYGNTGDRTEEISCTQDAKQCPDGSYVGQVGPECEYAPCPDNPAITQVSIKDYRNFESTINNVGFQYPPDYGPPRDSADYISLLSPPNPDMEKGSEVQDGELKIEIYISESPPGDSLEKYAQEKRSETSGQIVAESSRQVNGIDGIQWEWRGMGTGKTIYLIHAGKRYAIVKFPAMTTRDLEFESIISTFRFLK